MLLLMILSFAGYSLALFDTIQSVAVTGRLVCYGKPATDIKVKLYEKEIFFDKKLDQGKTDQDGRFSLHGSAEESTSIDPALYIYHTCNYNTPLLCRIASIDIPKDFVTEGNTPNKTFDVGTINLAYKLKDSLIAQPSVSTTAERMLLLIILSFAGYSLAFLGFGTIQSVALYNIEPVWDEKLDEKRTNQTGGFLLQGSTTEATSIDPKLYIYHTCNYGWSLSCRKFSIHIPSDYISEGTIPHKPYDIGTINLAGKISGEKSGPLSCYLPSLF
ncbi:unnamed protein product [Cylicocyclus nassatus]|uniref:Transthyretin-like family protein n=1 Tax=Cylicocyclus nassatus TaxID=53992 RepID=A0AA36H8I5_CYLNA|nr:unnamed protein product [Cylicocyclus nassatus]